MKILLGTPEWKLTEDLTKTRGDVYVSQREIQVADTTNFNEGDYITIFGAGLPYELTTPEQPVIQTYFKQAGTITREYCVVAITEDMAYSLSSPVVVVPNTPEILDDENFIKITPKNVEEAYQYLIYGKKDDENEFKLFGSIVAHPIPGDHNFSELKPPIAKDGYYPTNRETWYNFFIDDKGIPLSVIHDQIPIFLPFVLPEQKRSGLLRTKILLVDEIEKKIVVRDQPMSNSSKVVIVHDNYEIIQKALTDKNIHHIHLSAGRYPIYGNLRLTDKTIQFTGETLPSGESSKNGSELFFRGCFGFVLGEFDNKKAGRSVISHIRFFQSSNIKLVSGGDFISNDGIHGCGVLALSRASWIECVFEGFIGVGHAIWGDDVAFTNANTSYLEKCEALVNSGHGFYASGSDSNISTWLACSAMTNQGWGFKDDSQFGNNIISCHASANYAPYYLERGNGTIMGCYSESGSQKPSYIGSANNIVIGGTHGAGFTEDSIGFIALGRSHIHPFSVNFGKVKFEFAQRKNAHKRTNHIYRITQPEDDVFIPLDNRLIMDDTIENNPRLHYGFGSNLNNVGMSWSAGNPRGAGLMVFNRGFLLGPRNHLGEKKFTGIIREDRWDLGTYDVGDMIFDLSGKHYFFTPKEKFGIARDWQPDKSYSIGHTIQADEKIFRVNSLENPKKISGRSGNIVPDWSQSTVVDNDLVWEFWGSAGELNEDGARKYDRLGRVSTKSEVSILLQPNEIKDFEVTVTGVEKGYTIVATPEYVEDMISWNSFIKDNDAIVLRINNHEDRIIDRMVTFQIDCWSN